MFERFTERARRVVVLAQDEARRLGHDYIGTEHLLLGLLREEDGVGAQALSSLNVALDEVRGQVESIVGYGEGTGVQAPFTPRTKKVMEMALRESMQLGHDYIGTEHLLLGLAREGEGVANRILDDLGVGRRALYREVLLMLGEEPESDPLDRAEGTGARQTARDETSFRGRVESLHIGRRVGGWPRALTVDLDYVYSVRDTDEPLEFMDHEQLLALVVGVLEGDGLGTIEADIRELGWLVLERFPAVLEVEISATWNHAREGRGASGITVSRTFRR